MQNKTHKTFPCFDLSTRPKRLVYGNPEQNANVAESTEQIGSFVIGEYEMKRKMSIRSEKGDRKGSKATGEKIKVEKLKSNILNENRVWGKIKGKDEWVSLSGKEGKGKNVELLEKSEAKKKVLNKTKALEKDLKKEVEVSTYKGRAKECKNTRTESVTTIIREIAGEHAEQITKVTVTKKNGKVVKLEQFINPSRKDQLDYHIAGTEKHFKIVKGDTIAVGHDIVSATRVIPAKEGKPKMKVGIEHRQKRKNVEKAVGEVGADFELTTEAENEDLFEEIAEHNLGKDYLNETVIAQDIVNMGIRKVCKNFFVGEHGALLGLALSEKQKLPKLFDENGELRQGALAQITDVIVAAAGTITPTRENEFKQDAKILAQELALLVGVPTIVNAAIALAMGVKLAVIGYVPLAYIDIGRGIRQGKVRILDRGSVKFLTDIAIVEGEIAARKVSGEDVSELEAQKAKLELIGTIHKKELIDQALKKPNLSSKLRKKLERDSEILEADIAEREMTVSATPAEIEAYSSKSVNEVRNSQYQELQVWQNELEGQNGISGDLESIADANENIDENLDALESSFDIQQDKTEQLRVWYRRWFGGNIENPEAAIKELDEMVDSEVNGINGLRSRLKYRVGLWDNTDIVLNDILGIEKGQAVELSDFKNLTRLMYDPVEGDLPTTGGKQLALLQAGEGKTKKILSKLETYFTPYSEGGQVPNDSEFDHEYDSGRLKAAEKILKGTGSLQEKVIRLSVLASSQELRNISDRLALRANIREGMQIREAYQELQSAIEDRADLAEFINEDKELSKALSRVYKNAEWIEQAVDLKNLDQNASLHAEINDTLEAPLAEIKNLSEMLSGLAKEGLDEGEKSQIKSKLKGLESELAIAKKEVTELLKVSEKESRSSHKLESTAGIEDAELKTLNAKFENAPITEAAFKNPKEISDFVKLAEKFSGSMGSKEAFIAKVQEQFPEYKEFKNRKGTETSNLPMISPEQVSGDDKLARQLNLLALNVNQKGKNIVDTFYGNTKERTNMHIRASELAEAVGQATWLPQSELEAKYGKYQIQNTGTGNNADLNKFIKGPHSGGKFGGAYELTFERNITLKDGREFRIDYKMLSRGKCFNAVFIPSDGIEEIVKDPKTEIPKTIELKSLTPKNIAAVQRQLLLLALPIYFGGDGTFGKSGYGGGTGGKGEPQPPPPPSPIPPPFPT
jgi:hypothetical protein